MYNFDIITDRYNTNSLKYDFAREKGKPEGLLPLWVADMDFPLPEEVLADIRKAVDHGIFGYTEPKDGYYNAVIWWFKSRFGYYASQKEIIKTPGVVFAIACAVRSFTKPGESVLAQTPVYYPFYDTVRDNGRNLVTNPLVYENGGYSVNFEDFEKKISKNRVKLFLLCSPHNPVCRVWSREELEQMNKICMKHNVIVFSDEIHCDFAWADYKHTVFGLINENAIIATAPSKTFNLAGLQVSNIFIKNAAMREKFKAEVTRSGYGMLNTLGLAACESAYLKGGKWLEELRAYLADNIKFANSFLSDRLPKIYLVQTQATYLLWLDFKEYGFLQKELNRKITEGAKLWLNDGEMFGQEGNGFQRLNAACPRSVLEEAFNRLEKEF